MNVSAGIALIALNRPDKGNALSAWLVDDIIQRIEAVQHDCRVHTLVLVGEGRHFCTGFDLSDLNEESDATLLQRFVKIELLLDMIWNLPMRTVALAKGRTMGAGADLLTACDVRLAMPDTQIAFPGAKFGLVLGTSRLAARIGHDRAHCLIREGESLALDRACDVRLVTAVITNELDFPSCEWLEKPAINRSTLAALRAAAPGVSSDVSLAALVRSAARPGLKQRMLEYRMARK